MMDAFGADGNPASSNMPATTSFTDLEDPGMQDTSTSQPGWHPSGTDSFHWTSYLLD